MGATLAAGRGHVFGVTEGPGCRTVLAFMPDHPEEGVGTLARVRISEGPDGDVVFERSAERSMGLWAEVGENLLRIVPLLGPATPPPDLLAQGNRDQTVIKALPLHKTPAHAGDDEVGADDGRQGRAKVLW
ncbi:hypothetical protein [Streptomyces sp. NBC_00328]|uniref:hypothetical protein n=1 Tax=Streptomyces sp. NBC_00328 TaxID=2903646 RepID=UPI002E28FD28|nr:hypothetical protein [Streptomyces sp. NBC_00328]